MLVLNFTFIVFCKDGKYKFEISNFLISFSEMRRSSIGTTKYKAYVSGLINLKYPGNNKKEETKKQFRSNVESTVNASIQKIIVDFKNLMANLSIEDW